MLGKDGLVPELVPGSGEVVIADKLIRYKTLLKKFKRIIIY